MQKNSSKSKRIIKNTGFLYIRMLLLMCVSLYTSRVVLETLGIEDFGIYNVVGGFVGLFSVLSGSLSGACMRFLNFEMGRGDEEKLAKAFSTSVNIQLFLIFIIVFLCETVGIWFLNNKMVIPENRLTAANWVFQLSIITFCGNLYTVPYNAAIIAHERMKTFAYISVFEGVAKLAIAFMIFYSPIDTLIYYAALLCLLQISIRYIYSRYCIKNFPECKYHFVYDKELTKSMFVYSGWNFIGTSSSILRNQGGNILVNLFFGPSVNAARAVSNQVLHAITGFTNNFMTALKPQITQNYASGNWNYMMDLIFWGSRLTFYLILLLSLPIFLYTDYILHLWLKTVPDHSVLFVQLAITFTALHTLSGTLITAQLATGNIRNYQIVVGGIQLLNLPISYVVYKMGGIAESFVLVAIVCELFCLSARLYMLRPMIHLSIRKFLSSVILNIIAVTICASIIPLIMKCYVDTNIFSFICGVIITLMCTLISIYLVGCNKKERIIIKEQIKAIKNKLL